jgi:hypothetical protein
VRKTARADHGHDARHGVVLTLALTSRMQARGAPPEFLAVGRTVSAYGYPSTVEKHEMRAERITIDGKTIELH